MAIDGTHLDPNARSIWVDIYKVGSTVIFSTYTDEGVVDRPVHIDEEFVGKMLASFEALTAEGDRVTVLKEHRIDGDHYGTAHELRVKDGWVQARVAFVPSVWDAYDDHRVVEFSPGFVPKMKNAHTGEIHENVLLEVTITAMALQHTLRTPQETNASAALLDRMLSGSLTIPGEIMEEEENEQPAVESPEEEEEEVSELEAAQARIAELEATLEAMMDEREEMEASMEDRIRVLEDEVTRAELTKASVPVEHFPHLLALKRANASLFAASVQALSKPDKQTPIGVTGSAPVGEVTGPGEILEEAHNAGVRYGSGLTAWLAKNHPDNINDVISIARNQKD